MRSRILRIIALLLAGASVNAYAVAVPPAVFQPATPKAAEPAAMLTPAGTGGYVIALPAPTDVLKSRPKVLSRDPKAQARTGDKGRPLQIGFARAVPDGAAALALEKLQWVNTADGGRAARVVVTSPGASALRLGMSVAAIASGVSVRFAGSGGVFGPVTAAQMTATKRYWSPVLDGDSATMELYLPAGVALSSVKIALPEVSHLVVTGSGLKAEPTDEIGQSDSCERDVACIATPAALNQAKAVAKMVFTDQGDTFLCTGTLLNDSIHSNTAYFYTANHCMSSTEAADSLVTYWFFDAATCGSNAVPAYQTVTGGAMFLGRSIDSDWALLRLRAPPPANAVFSAWRADVLANSTPIVVIHHPSGDLKKFSSGTMPGYFTFSDDGSSYSTARYTQGSTEGGSSGSGLLTLGTGGSFYELRGGLFGGASSCSTRRADRLLLPTRRCAAVGGEIPHAGRSQCHAQDAGRRILCSVARRLFHHRGCDGDPRSRRRRASRMGSYGFHVPGLFRPDGRARRGKPCVPLLRVAAGGRLALLLG